MRQMLLDWGTKKPQTLDTFVTGRNQEVAHQLQLVANRAAIIPNDRFIYLWGDSGAGKSHLLQALASAPDARYIPATADAADFLFSPEIKLYLLDDCEQLSPERQIAAFNLFNEVKEHRALLVTTGAMPPATLTVREDLRTRMGWGLIYQLHGLSDEEKIEALQHAAQLRGLNISAGVLPYLTTHFCRDMTSLSSMLDALDRYSLEMKRPITLALLRNLLELEGEIKT